MITRTHMFNVLFKIAQTFEGRAIHELSKQEAAIYNILDAARTDDTQWVWLSKDHVGTKNAKDEPEDTIYALE